MREIIKTIMTIVAVALAMMSAIYLVKEFQTSTIALLNFWDFAAGPAIIGLGLLLSAIFASLLLKKDSDTI